MKKRFLSLIAIMLLVASTVNISAASRFPAFDIDKDIKWKNYDTKVARHVSIDYRPLTPPEGFKDTFKTHNDPKTSGRAVFGGIYNLSIRVDKGETIRYTTSAMRYGEKELIVEIKGKDQKTTLVFIEPETSYVDVDDLFNIDEPFEARNYDVFEGTVGLDEGHACGRGVTPNNLLIYVRVSGSKLTKTDATNAVARVSFFNHLNAERRFSKTLCPIKKSYETKDLFVD